MNIELTDQEADMLRLVLAELYPEARGAAPDDEGYHMRLTESLRAKLHVPDRERPDQEPGQTHEQMVERICGKVALDWQDAGDEPLHNLAGFLATRTYRANLPYVLELAEALAHYFAPLEREDVLFLLADHWARAQEEQDENEEDADA